MKWLYEREDVDKQHFVYYGGNQGGFFGFNQMALAEGRFTAGLLHIPAYCDTSGSLIGRHPMRPPGEDAEAVIETMGYYDPVNFDRHIACPVMVTVGVIDNACHPSGVYAAYNTLPGRSTSSTAWKAGTAASSTTPSTAAQCTGGSRTGCAGTSTARLRPGGTSQVDRKWRKGPAVCFRHNSS